MSSDEKGCCIRCGSPYQVSLHEPLCGRNRQLSIKYDLRVPLCFTCHRFAHDEPSQEYNDSLKIEMQRKFELANTRDEFIHKFGRGYIIED